MLNPANFRALGRKEAIGTEISHTVMTHIIHLLALHRTKITRFSMVDGREVSASDEIPPYRIQTIELRLSPAHQTTYDKIHTHWAERLHRVVKVDPVQGHYESTSKHRNNGSHRALCQAAFDTRLGTFLTVESGLHVT
jgi:hypothetical protein